MNEANKKTPRTFQCRNQLWRTYEDMAKELECSIDYLINDAMKQYARQRGYAGDLPSNVSMPPPISNVLASAASEPAPAVNMPGAPPMPLGVMPPGAMPSRGPGQPPPRPASSAPPPGAMPPGTMPGRVAPLGAPPTATTPGSGSFPHPVPPPPRAGGGSGAFPNPAPVPPPPRTSMVTGGPPGAPPRPPAARSAMNLTLHFEGNAYPVTKDRFIIGRGKANSDLTIRDPNISRQHALVEFAGGTYYIVDMGSTNGIEFRGQRVQRKAIQNGDVFRICDHEVFCSMA